MLRKLSDYGLNEFYDFREVNIPATYEVDDIHRIIVDCISPVINELESNNVINGFHFILSEDLFLRLSTESWDKNESFIKGVLIKHGLSDKLKNWDLVSPEIYGGTVGVILSYNNLEFNSRLIMALLDAEKTNDITIKADLQRYGYNFLLCTQWVHHLYIQYGIRNDAQLLLEFADSLGWLRELVSNNFQDAEVKDFAIRSLHSMSKDIDQFIQKLSI